MKKNIIILSFVFVSIFLLCSCRKDYPDSKFKRGQVIVSKVENNLKGQIIKKLYYSRDVGWKYRVRWVTNTEKTNTYLLSDDGYIEKFSFSMLWMREFELEGYKEKKN